MMLYTYYGDDFTGSTDVLESLAQAGVQAALFLRPPEVEDLAAFPGLQAVGIAGDSRSRSPEWMAENLPEVFARLKAFGAPVAHYKTCSTFDSAPHVGSIGRALELGIAAFGEGFTPIAVAAPHLGRFVGLGLLYAVADGVRYRIDRHPTMSRHPVTPMLEPDLRRHLALQTRLKIALVDLRHLNDDGLDAALLDEPSAVLFDGVDEAHVAAVGEMVWHRAQGRQMFAVGSSGLTEGLISAWRSVGLVGDAPTATRAAAAEQIVVLSGSCSPVTEAQIAWGLAHGFTRIAVDVDRLIASSDAALCEALQCLRSGGSPILYTAMGAMDADAAKGAELGVAVGRLLLRIVEETGVRRVVLCGGDTSSHAMQQLPVRALTWAAGLATGAPLCRADAPGTVFDGVEFCLKGGQVGPTNFFGLAKG